MTEVYIDSMFLGKVEDPKLFVDQLKTERRVNNVTKELNVYFDHANDQVLIETEKGRLRRPLIIVENGESKLKKEHLDKIEKGQSENLLS